MSLPADAQRKIQARVEAATEEELIQMQATAEDDLYDLQEFNELRMMPFTKGHRYKFDHCIEIIARIEAVINNKGWWFRFVRRFQLCKEHSGSCG